jgi:hypothetical protein
VGSHELPPERGDRAEEPHDEVVGRLVVQLVGGADLLHPALVDDDDLVGDLECLLLVVRDEHGGDVHLVVQSAQPVPQFLAHLGVQRPERLVEQQHGRLHREGPGQRHPLPLTARELRRQPVGELRKMDQRQQVVHPLPDLGLGPLADLEPERDVAPHRQVLERGVVLEHEPDVALLRRQAGGVDALDPHGPAVGAVQPGDDAQQRGLASAGRPEQGGQLSGRDAHRHVVERDERSEALRHVLDLDAHRVSFGRRTETMMMQATATRARRNAAA